MDRFAREGLAFERATRRLVGLYDRVIAYDAVASPPAERPVAFVDMAGNGALTSALHHYFRDRLKHSAVVGMTHWEHGERQAELPGPPPRPRDFELTKGEN